MWSCSAVAFIETDGKGADKMRTNLMRKSNLQEAFGVGRFGG